MYTVHFVGLNYFNACTVGPKEVLIPDGTKGDDDVPVHNASVFIEESDYASDNWWSQHRHRRKIQLEYKLGHFRTVDVIEFRIPKTVKLDFQCSDRTVENVNLDDGLPKLQDIGFKLAQDPEIIANVPIPGGELEVFRFGSAALVRWLIRDHDNPVKITAHDGDQPKSVTLKKKSGTELPAEIVFSNTIDLLPLARTQGGNGQESDPHDAVSHDMSVHGAIHDATHGSTHTGSGHGGAGHFVLYAKLDEQHDERKFENVNLPDFTRLTPLPFSHPYLSFLSALEEVPDAPCVPSCCGGKV